MPTVRAFDKLEAGGFRKSETTAITPSSKDEKNSDQGKLNMEDVDFSEIWKDLKVDTGPINHVKKNIELSSKIHKIRDI